MRVGFLGLGLMGSSMGTDILKSGCGLTVYSWSGQKLRPFADASARTAGSPAELVVTAFVTLRT